MRLYKHIKLELTIEGMMDRMHDGEFPVSDSKTSNEFVSSRSNPWKPSSSVVQYECYLGGVQFWPAEAPNHR